MNQLLEPSIRFYSVILFLIYHVHMQSEMQSILRNKDCMQM